MQRIIFLAVVGVGLLWVGCGARSIETTDETYTTSVGEEADPSDEAAEPTE